ncbi:MAG: CDP-diacylglycerol--glycerol-3-phosphate 3-phosphatidyltransferase [Clostridia bacterium]|nr:CDP-diacylglycerol--glycerol-3-phosphate 3-phosphatidyltransferase [Clostridia bacterium]
MNTANKITLLRVVLVPIFMALFMIENNTACTIAALVVFILAAISDAVDGYIARNYNQITNFGKFVDPLADKMLTTAAYVILLHYGRMDVWALMIVLAREFMVSGVRLVAAADGKVIAASTWGKLKTISQMVGIIAAILLMLPIFSEEASIMVTAILIWISVVFAVISGVDYIVKNRHVIKM